MRIHLPSQSLVKTYRGKATNKTTAERVLNLLLNGLQVLVRRPSEASSPSHGWHHNRNKELALDVPIVSHPTKEASSKDGFPRVKAEQCLSLLETKFTSKCLQGGVGKPSRQGALIKRKTKPKSTVENSRATRSHSEGIELLIIMQPK